MKRHRKRSHSEALEIRGSRSSRTATSRYGHHSRLDVREAMRTAINGRLDAISSIFSAMQRISAGPADAAKRYRISDLIPKSWDGSHGKGPFRNFMVELHLWMQARSYQGERILVRVEGVDKVEKQTSERSRPLCTRFCAGRQQTNH